LADIGQLGTHVHQFDFGLVRALLPLLPEDGFLTWRAQSSPRHACGLNVSFFLHACTQPKPARAVGYRRDMGGLKPCGTLHRGCICNAPAGVLEAGKGGGLKKRVISETG
jgi:hypothetical protein